MKAVWLTGWRRVDENWWYREGYGSVSRQKDGWYGSNSAYPHVVLSPSVGPFRSARRAIFEWTKLWEVKMKKRQPAKVKIIDMTSPKQVRATESFKREVDAKLGVRQTKARGKTGPAKIDKQGWEEIGRSRYGVMVKSDNVYVLERVEWTRKIDNVVHCRSEIEVADTLFPQDLVKTRHDLLKLVSTVSHGVAWIENALIADKRMKRRAEKRGVRR